MNLISRLLYKSNPDNRLYFYEGFSPNKIATVRDLRNSSQVLAAALIRSNLNQSLGGQPVLICLPNCFEFAVSFFGVIMAGGIPVPMTTAQYVTRDYFKSLCQHIGQITNAQICLTFEKTIPNFKIKCFSPSQILKDSQQPLREDFLSEISAQSLAMLQFSSGSTVEPKGVQLTHQMILANLEQIRQGMQVTNKDILNSWLPFYHDMGLIGGLLSVLYNDVEAHFTTPSDFIASPEKWLKSVVDTKSTVMMGPNFLYKNLVKRISPQVRKTLDLSNIRLALSGSEPVSEKICEEFCATYSQSGFNSKAFFPVYGMAENTLAITFPQVHAGIKTLEVTDKNSSEFGQKFVSCGRPLKGIDLRISDEKNQILSEGQVGEVQYRSPSMTMGYWNASDKTKALFTDDGWLRSGDLGFVHNHELAITGRIKDLIIVNGRKFYPQDLESLTSETSTLKSGFKMGRTAAFSYSEAYALVVETKEWLPGRRRALKKYLAEKSYAFTMRNPSHVYLVAPCVLPRTSSGKLKRFVLKEWQSQGVLKKHEGLFLIDWFATEIRMMAEIFRYLKKNRKSKALDDSTVLMNYLAFVFSEVIRVQPDKVSLEKSFLDYQLDSVQIIQLNTRLKEELVEIPLLDFLNIQNLVQLRNYIMENHQVEIVKIRKKGVPWT